VTRIRNFTIPEAIIIFLFIVFVVILSPILVPIYIYDHFNRKLKEGRFRKYLASNVGAKYFCYTHRKNSQDYVKTHILPRLAEDVKVIYITDKMFNLGNDIEFFDEIVWKMKSMKRGFPCLAKAANGELATESINSELYTAIANHKDDDKIIKKINRFYGRDSVRSEIRQGH